MIARIGLSPRQLAKLTAKHYPTMMPRGPKGEKRPADVIGNAVHVMRIATGQIIDDVPTPEQEGKSAAAVELGRLGGAARAKGMSAKRRKEIARKAAMARWK
jgi:hypothetical protein